MHRERFILSIDDFALLMSDFDDLRRIKKHYDDFKITCFTVPIPKEFFLKENQNQFRRDKYKEWAKIVNSLDWIEVALHGFAHTEREFECVYDKATEMLQATENLFKEVGLKYKKIFKAPYWQYSYDSLNALKDKGYIVALNRNFPITVPEGLETYFYNWSFEEKQLPPEKVVKGHGHAYPTTGVKNAIGNCYQNIIKQIPEKARFEFVSELYAKKKS